MSLPAKKDPRKKIIEYLERLTTEEIGVLVDFAEFLSKKKEGLNKNKGPISLGKYHLGAMDSLSREDIYEERC